MKQNTFNAQESTLVFVHIAKTGGTTLKYLIERKYPTNQTFNVYPPRHKGRLEQFKEFSTEERKQYKYVQGHGVFSLQDYFINPYYITLLRHPIERVISHYYFLIGNSAHKIYSLYRQVMTNNMSFEEYLHSGIFSDLDNGQVRTLSRMPSLYGECTQEMLQKAKENLKHYFSVFGTTDDFDKYLVLLKKKLGWVDFPVYTRKNVTKNRATWQDLPASTLKTIEKYNELDLELYQFAKQEFDVLYNTNCTEMNLVLFNIFNRTFNQLKFIKSKLVLGTIC